MPSGSELERRLTVIAGEDEWARQGALDRLREDGLPGPEVEVLAGYLADPDATTRAAARMALSALASPGSASRDTAQRALRSALHSDHEDVRVLAASALGEAGDPGVGEDLILALDDAPNVAAAAADALGALGYGPALRRIAELSEESDFWVRAAAIVALGRLEDERAVPTLARLAEDPGLEMPLVEALERINHPSALEPLARIYGTAPDEALRSAGAILSSNPDVEPPDWVRAGARERQAALIHELVKEDEPAVAHLLGLAASPEAVETLMELLGPPRRSEAALAGLLAVPAELRVGTIFQRLDEADHQETLILLSLLPPLRDHERIVRLVPYLADADEAVRGAAAEALARAPAAEALPLLASELDREGVAPEVIRALGGLGEEACAALTPLLMDPVPGVRVAAARALSRCAGRAIEGQLRKAYATESDGEARQGLLLALGRSVGGRALDLLEDALASESVDDRLAAIEALGLTGDDGAVAHLEGALGGSPAEALAALQALGDLGRPGVGPILERHLTDESLDVRRTAARAALKVPDAVGAGGVEAMTRDPDGWIRSCGARLLATRGEAGRERLAVMAENDPDPQVRRRARRGLEGGD